MKIKFRALCLTALVVVLAFASVASALPRYIVTDQPGNAYIMSLNSDNTFTSNDMSNAGSLNDYTLYSLADYKYVLAVGNASIGVFTANGTSDPVWTKSATTTVREPKIAAADSNGNIGLVYEPIAKPGTTSSDSFLKVVVDDDGKLTISNVDLGRNIEANARMMAAWTNFFVIVSDEFTGSGAEQGGYKLNVIEFPFSVTNTTIANSVAHSVDVAATFGVSDANMNNGVSSDRTYLSVASGDWAYLSTGYHLYTFEKPTYSLNPEVGLTINQVYAGHLLGLQVDDKAQPIAVVSSDGTAPHLVKLELMRFDAPASDGTFNSTNYRTRSISDDIRILGNGSDLMDVGDVTIAYDKDSDYVTVINVSFDEVNDPTAQRAHGRLVVYQPSGNTWAVVASCDLEPTAVAAQIASTGGSSGGDDTPTTQPTVVDPTALTDEQKANLKDATGGEAADFVTTATEATGTTPDTTVTANVRSAAGTGFESATVAAVKNYTLASDGYILVKAAGYNAANVKVFFVPVSTSSATVAADSTSEGVLLDSSYAKITSGTSAFASSAEKLTAGTYTLVTATKTASTTPEDEGSTTSSSSGGCDAGLGLWAAAALMAVSTLSKRR